MSGSNATTTRAPKCARCTNHGISVDLKGHKRHCKYAFCKCSKCELVAWRRVVMARQVALRRQEKEDDLFHLNRSKSTSNEENHSTNIVKSDQSSSVLISRDDRSNSRSSSPEGGDPNKGPDGLKTLSSLALKMCRNDVRKAVAKLEEAKSELLLSIQAPADFTSLLSPTRPQHILPTAQSCWGGFEPVTSYSHNSTGYLYPLPTAVKFNLSPEIKYDTQVRPITTINQTHTPPHPPSTAQRYHDNSSPEIEIVGTPLPEQPERSTRYNNEGIGLRKAEIIKTCQHCRTTRACGVADLHCNFCGSELCY